MQKTRFITFYSYKGGVGRTLALGNIAWEAAIRGKKVVIIDFDLEAPGIPSLLPFSSQVSDHLEDKGKYGGIFELILYYQKHGVIPSISDFFCTAPIIDEEFKPGGCISIIPAGREDTKYKEQLQSFNWQDFFEKGNGRDFFLSFRQTIELQFETPDLVLIDSRTGLTDIGGICTLILPDRVVALTGLNKQNVKGTQSIAEAIDQHSIVRQQEWTLPSIELILVASPVPDGQEVDLTQKRIQAAEGELNREIKVMLPYVPILALEERLLVQRRGKGIALTLMNGYLNLYDLINQ